MIQCQSQGLSRDSLNLGLNFSPFQQTSGMLVVTYFLTKVEVVRVCSLCDNSLNYTLKICALFYLYILFFNKNCKKIFFHRNHAQVQATKEKAKGQSKKIIQKKRSLSLSVQANYTSPSTTFTRKVRHNVEQRKYWKSHQFRKKLLGVSKWKYGMLN